MSDTVHGREHLVRRQQAMSAVFARFAGVWKQAFAAKLWPDMLETWLDSAGGIDTELLEPAARQMLSDGELQFPPKPWQFAKFARGLQRKHSGETAPVAMARPDVWEWSDPETNRVIHIERHSDGWSAGSMDLRSYTAFVAMTDREKLAYCGHMAVQHPLAA